MKHRMNRTQSTNAFTGAEKTNYKTKTSTLGLTGQRMKQPAYSRKTDGPVFDPENPFTFWLKGTDKLNDELEEEKELKRFHIKSAQSGGRRIPYYERLNKKPGTQTREGFFRKLRNEIGKPRFTGRQRLRGVQRADH
jgi:hypothetical protein